MKIDDQLLERVAKLSTPHMKAIDEAVTAAFPHHNPDQMYTLAIAIQLGALLHALADTDRPHAVETINAVLTDVNVNGSSYRLLKLDS
jgi:hypothetical protein